MKSNRYIGYEIIENLLTWSEFIVVANVRLDKNGPGALLAIENRKGRPKFVVWMDSPAQKLGIRSHLDREGKKGVVFKKVPFKQQSWHRVVIHVKMLNHTNPSIDLYVDCKFVERKVFPLSIRKALLEDRARLDLRLGQIKNLGKDVMKFVVSISLSPILFLTMTASHRWSSIMSQRVVV